MKQKLTSLDKLKNDYLGKAGDATTKLKRYIPYKAMEVFMAHSKIPWHTVIHAHHVSLNPLKVLRFFNHHDEYHPYTHGLMEVKDLVTGETHHIAHSYTHPSFTTHDTIYGSSGQVLCDARGSNHFNTWKDGCAKLDPYIPNDESCKTFTKRFHSPPHHPKMGLCRALLRYGLL